MILLLLAMLIWGLIKFWYVALGALALYAIWLCATRATAAHRREVEDHLRHARARQEIDHIATATARAMHEAARRHGSTIEGTAREVRRP